MMKNNLTIEIGYQSINHYGEELCGDHVEFIAPDDENSFLVLADGLGSGVKASILSTLTSKILCTMMAAGLSLETCVEAVIKTLPVCSVRGVAYSTFTIVHIVNNEYAELIQYDNPLMILIRNNEVFEYEKKEVTIQNKRVFISRVKLEEGDVFIAMSDGAPHAGIGLSYNFGWRLEDIAEYMKCLVCGNFSAKTLSTLLIEECDNLYEHKPGDDVTAAVLKVRKRSPMNIVFGPPSMMDDNERMMSLFFSKDGKHIVCGGTTSKIAATYLKEEVCPTLDFGSNGVPPIATIKGVDLVTEGVITISKVIEYAKDYLGENKMFDYWSRNKDGASLISRLLFEEGTDINFFVGRAINPAHQNPDLPINFNIKMNLVKELSECLRKMGKKVNVVYF